MPSGAVRDLKKEKHWRRMVRNHAASGLSVRAWCRKHGEKDAAFYWWRRELARRDAENSEPTFVPVCVTGDAPTDTHGGIEILLAGGRRVQVSGRVDRQMLTDVLAVLEGRAC
jgi:transposase